MTTGEPGYIDVLVTVRTADDGERRFWVELDPTADLQKWLLPDLVQALHLGNPGNFKLTLEGSLNSLVVILTSKEPSAPPARRPCPRLAAGSPRKETGLMPRLMASLHYYQPAHGRVPVTGAPDAVHAGGWRP